MLEPTSRSRWRRAAVLVASSALVLSGCGGDGDDDAEAGGDATTSPTPVPSPTVEVVDGLELTPPGTQLAFGETATVAHEVGRRTGVLDVSVDSAVQGSLKDFAGFDLDDPYKRRGNYYYVRVTVTNVGDTRLGTTPVPLWGLSGENTLLQAVEFTSSFKKCPTEPLPAKFRPDDQFKTCLVFLSPDKGELEGVSYRPTEDSIPIVWRGQVRKPGKPKNQRNGAGQD